MFTVSIATKENCIFFFHLEQKQMVQIAIFALMRVQIFVSQMFLAKKVSTRQLFTPYDPK